MDESVSIENGDIKFCKFKRGKIIVGVMFNNPAMGKRPAMLVGEAGEGGAFRKVASFTSPEYAQLFIDALENLTDTEMRIGDFCPLCNRELCRFYEECGAKEARHYLSDDIHNLLFAVADTLGIIKLSDWLCRKQDIK